MCVEGGLGKKILPNTPFLAHFRPLSRLGGTSPFRSHHSPPRWPGLEKGLHKLKISAPAVLKSAHRSINLCVPAVLRAFSARWRIAVSLYQKKKCHEPQAPLAHRGSLIEWSQSDTEQARMRWSDPRLRTAGLRCRG